MIQNPRLGFHSDLSLYFSEATPVIYKMSSLLLYRLSLKRIIQGWKRYKHMGELLEPIDQLFETKENSPNKQ